MRIRQIKPSFFSDERVATLPDSVRLFYIGTWLLADDGGYLEWDVAEVGLQLYGYSARSVRERWVLQRSERLVETGRLEIYHCGHAFVPHLVEHQHLPGNKTFTVANAHSRCSPQIPAVPRPAFPRGSPQRSGQVRSGQGSSGQVDAHAHELTASQIQQQIDDPTTSPQARKVWQKALAQKLTREAAP